MSQPRKNACLSCRARKVKCVPGVPRCGRCTELGLEECVYGQKKKRTAGNLLRMGEACLPCRKRKKKCDARRPCSTCIDAKKPGECIYDGPPPGTRHNQMRRILPAADPNARSLVCRHESEAETLFTNGGDLTGTSRLGNQAQEMKDSFAPSDPPGSTIGLAPTGLGFPLPSLEEEVPLAIAPNFQSPGVQPATSPSDLVLFQGNVPKQDSYEDLCIRSFLSSALFERPKVPRTPHIPLSFLGEQNSRISHTTSELELTLWVLGPLLKAMVFVLISEHSRLAGLIRMRKMGAYLAPRKQEALVNGDMSGVVLHPYFVHKVISFGMHHSTIVVDSPPMVLLHARYIQSFWEELVNIHQENNYDLKVQSLLFLIAGCMFVRFPRLAGLYLWKTCRMLNAAEMRFIPKYGHPPPFSDEVHEKSTVLSQLIWMENYLFLTCYGERPKLTARIEEEFRNELPAIYPVLFRVCPLTMRTQGILLVRDVVLLLERLQIPGERPGDWGQSCDHLASCLDDYSDTLMIHLGEFDKANDTEGASIVRSNCIACLSHLAVLYHFIGEIRPSARETTNGLCDAVLDNLGNLTQGLKLEEVTLFDLLLEHSWTKAIKVYDSRIASLSLEEAARLWCWRQVVAEACVDLERRMPKGEPPVLTSLALLEDGRSEGSKYPNLMVPAAREHYGI